MSRTAKAMGLFAVLVLAVAILAAMVISEKAKASGDSLYPIYQNNHSGPVTYIKNRDDGCYIWMGDREDRPSGREYCR